MRLSHKTFDTNIVRFYVLISKFVRFYLKFIHSIDFQIIHFTRLEGKIRVSRADEYLVEDFD